jgi:iron-sulfur cluster repair protein YtfE (RIC family)
MTNLSEPTAHSLTDVRDMVIVHRAFRRELLLSSRLVRAVTAGDTARAGVLARHVRLVLTGLHLHHTSEDELLWPKLLQRATPSGDLVRRMEAQHHRVEDLIDRLGPALTRWEAEARPAVAHEVSGTLEELHHVLVEHLDEEEREILPLAARHLTTEEWDALGEHGLAGMSRSQLPLMFGMVIEDATPEERAFMLSHVPAPVRLLLRTVFARRYRRYVSDVRGNDPAAR